MKAQMMTLGFHRSVAKRAVTGRRLWTKIAIILMEFS